MALKMPPATKPASAVFSVLPEALYAYDATGFAFTLVTAPPTMLAAGAPFGLPHVSMTMPSPVEPEALVVPMSSGMLPQ